MNKGKKLAMDLLNEDLIIDRDNYYTVYSLLEKIAEDPDDFQERAMDLVDYFYTTYQIRANVHQLFKSPYIFLNSFDYSKEGDIRYMSLKSFNEILADLCASNNQLISVLKIQKNLIDFFLIEKDGKNTDYAKTYINNGQIVKKIDNGFL